MELPHAEVKSRTGLSSLRVSCKRALKYTEISQFTYFQPTKVYTFGELITIFM